MIHPNDSFEYIMAMEGEIYPAVEGYPDVGEVSINTWPYDTLVALNFVEKIDINGREIYEGDIVKIYYYLHGKIDKIRIDEIIFSNCKFDFKSPICNEELSSSEVEIIGNKYESTEIENIGDWIK